jgi:hypothetical protein
MEPRDRAVELLQLAREPMTVIAAELPDGSAMKITGHNRAKIWARAKQPQPPLKVITVPVSGKDEAGRLYDAFEQLLPPELM